MSGHLTEKENYNKTDGFVVHCNELKVFYKV